jgi:signal transduction histidine kinase
VFDKDDGLTGNQLYSSNREGSDKIMAVASDEALNIIDLEHYYSISEGPKVHLDDISILNRPVGIGETDSVHGVSLSRNPDLMERLELDYGHKEFSLEFAALQFYSPEAVIYRYRMIGFNDNWLEGHRNRVSYTNLDPGAYTFEVQASVASGIWGPSKQLDIYINPPFWKTWWFIALVILAVAGLLYLIHRYRLQKAIALANLRNQIAQDLHDDIGSSLTKISLYSSLMADEKSDIGFLKQIGELSREVIGQMSDIVWSVDQKYDSAGNLISKMREFASETLEVCGVGLEFNTDNIQQNAFVDPLFRQNFYLIFKEAINNICKHANASRVIVRVSHKDGTYSLLVEDNGKGISVTHDGVYAGNEHEPTVKPEGKGNGLYNMRKRAERIGLVITIRDREDGGTVISLG